MTNALLIAAVFLIAGVALRARVRALATVHVPAALVAGLLALAAVQVVQALSPGRGVAVGALLLRAAAEWEVWRSPLIPIIFAAMLLVKPASAPQQQARSTIQQGLAAWFLIVGQLALGLLATWLVLGPVFNVPIHFGQLLEVSWAGGFGSSNAWGAQHERLAVFPGARDLANFFTTTGLLYGVLSGVVLANIAIRRGWTAASTDSIESTAQEQPVLRSEPCERARSIDPLMLQMLILAAAFGVGVVLQQGILAGLRIATPDTSFGSDLPLFVFTLLGGWLVRRFLTSFGMDGLIDNEVIQRLSGVALELLVFVAIATLKVAVIRENAAAAMILMLVGAIWVWFNVVWVSPRLLPQHCWFELAIMNHGFATATTAQGMMLLRMVDPGLRTDAARLYAQAAPLTAMFIGGGLITYMLPLLLQRVPVAILIASCTLSAIVIFVIGRRLRKGLE